MKDVDCMACIANLAAGAPRMGQAIQTHDGITHDGLRMIFEVAWLTCKRRRSLNVWFTPEAVDLRGRGPMTDVDCMACIAAASRGPMRAADPGLEIILGSITHSAYADRFGTEWLTCRRTRPVGFRELWLDAVTRAMRGLRARPS